MKSTRKAKNWISRMGCCYRLQSKTTGKVNFTVCRSSKLQEHCFMNLRHSKNWIISVLDFLLATKVKLPSTNICIGFKLSISHKINKIDTEHDNFQLLWGYLAQLLTL